MMQIRNTISKLENAGMKRIEYLVNPLGCYRFIPEVER